MTGTCSKSMHGQEAHAEPGVRPAAVIMLGRPRSRTTWLGEIRDSAPDTGCRHEPDSDGRKNFLPLARSIEQANDCAADIRRFFDSLGDVRDSRVAASRPVYQNDCLGHFSAAWNRAAMFGSKATSRIAGEMCAPLWLPRRANPGSRHVAAGARAAPSFPDNQ